MPRLQSSIRAALATTCALLASSTLGADPDSNAALHYWRTWSQMDEPLRVQIAEIDRKSLGDNTWQAPDNLDLNSNESRDLVGKLQRASSFEKSDFAIEYELGPHAIVPHLGPMRMSATLLAADARARLDRGDGPGAAASIASGYEIASHCAQERLLISALVATAIFEANQRVALYALDTGTLSDADRMSIGQALERFDPDDPFGVRRAIAGEGAFMPKWIEKAALEGSSEEILAMLANSGVDPKSNAYTGVQRTLTQGEKAVKEQVHLMRSLFVQIDLAFDAENPGAMLAKIDNAIGEGEYGVFARVFAPATSRLHDQYAKGVAMYEEARGRFAG